jgi:hypothetical protein
VLERSFSSVGFRARIYQVDFAGATQTESVEKLRSDSVVPLGKRRLWESAPSFATNLEGLTLGPPLESGATSLLLVADDGGVGAPVLVALRLRLTPTQPRAVPPGEGAEAPTGTPARD